MAAQFILSLDCEGKWGVADHLGAREQRCLTDARLRTVYSAILRLLDKYDCPATFAFVGLFGESSAGFRRLRPEVDHFAQGVREYLGPALQDIDQGSGQGWHGDWAIELVGRARQSHEIALHGVTHVPWDKLSHALAMDEMRLYRQLSSEVAASRTFVYPRNRVAHTHLLERIGIEGFRLAPKARNRLASLASEFNLLSPPEADSPVSKHGLVPIPAGYFVNWQNGLRLTVPKVVSRLRFANMLKRAELRNDIVHVWLHPENVATAPGTLSLLEAFLRRVATERELGRCEVLTQLEYVSRMRSAGNLSDGLRSDD